MLGACLISCVTGVGGGCGLYGVLGGVLAIFGIIMIISSEYP